MNADELESLVDSHGLSGVLQALEEVCYAKAEHLRGNWQDEASAKSWEKAAKAINKAVGVANSVGV